MFFFFYVLVYFNNLKVVDIVGIVVDDKDQFCGYYLVVIVKVDFLYKMLDDLKGKVFGFVDLDFIFGYLIFNYVFKEKFGGNVDNKYNNIFFSVIFFGGYEQDIFGVLNG